jgi:urease subunit alpha
MPKRQKSEESGRSGRPPWLDSLEDQRHRESIEPEEYLAYFGPTVGDRVRLADTHLFLTVEEDYCRHEASGNEAVFGGGKVIRESMGQSVLSRDDGTPDTVITGALILDHWGIVKADVALRGGKIQAIGKAGNPEIMSDVGAAGDRYTDDPTTDLVIGPETEIIAGNGLILTAGAIDSHVHVLLPDLAPHALSGGITTFIGGGTGLATGSVATTATPGAWHITQMIKALDTFPLNVGLHAKGSSAEPAALQSQAEAGACGFKIHEDWGATPKALEVALKAADDYGMQVSLHADSLNEAGFFESTKKVIRDSGRSIHSFHTEGAGGGHAPDILKMASMAEVLPASTNPTLPFTKNTMTELTDMVILCHHLNPDIASDLAFAESRVRRHTIFAENVLHDFGALSITSSDALAMGRIGELVMRTWQTADFMKWHWERQGGFPDPAVTGGMDMSDDNQRAKRYVAKYTINPAIAQGIAHSIGSVEVGKYADLVLWDPRFFGVRSEMVLQGGVQVWAVSGDPNASVTQPEPYWGRPNWATSGKAVSSATRMFVSPAAGVKRADGKLDLNPDGSMKRRKDPGTDKPWVAIEPTKRLRKDDMRNNSTRPVIQVGRGVYVDAPDNPGQRVVDDAISFIVTIGDQDEGKEYPAPRNPPERIPMAQRYSLF